LSITIFNGSLGSGAREWARHVTYPFDAFSFSIRR
jgi:hypothetical protein